MQGPRGGPRSRSARPLGAPHSASTVRMLASASATSAPASAYESAARVDSRAESTEIPYPPVPITGATQSSTSVRDQLFVNAARAHRLLQSGLPGAQAPAMNSAQVFLPLTCRHLPWWQVDAGGRWTPISRVCKLGNYASGRIRAAAVNGRK